MPRIPKKSVLKQFERRGSEGKCQACGEKVSAHVGKGGQWLGCRNTGVGITTPLILIPDRRAMRRGFKGASSPQNHAPAQAHDTTARPAKVAPAAPQPPAAPARTPVHYAAKFPVSAVNGLTPRDSEIYRVIARKRVRGMTAPELAKALKLKTTRGVVESALQRLKARKVLKLIDADSAAA